MIKLFKSSLLLITLVLFSCSSDSENTTTNTLPIASFSFENTVYYSGDVISFTESSADGDGTIVGWSWDFGDGTSSELKNPSHSFTSVGTFTITLTVTDNDNGTSSLSREIQISEGQSTGDKIFKVMTFNIHRGESYLGEFDIDAIVNVIKAENPDYVMLQEVDYNTQRNGVIDMAKVLGEKTGMNHYFGKAIDYQGGEFGNAVLSRRTITSPQNIALPSTNEARAVLKTGSLVSSNTTISIISAHFDYGTNSDGVNSRKNSATLINNTFAINEVPSIVAGDFNEEPADPAISILKEKWTFCDASNTATFPSNDASKKIDYIGFYPANRWTLMSVKVVNNTLASDHNPIVITIKLKD